MEALTAAIEKAQELTEAGYDIYLRWTENVNNDIRRNFSALDGQTFSSREACASFYAGVFGIETEEIQDAGWRTAGVAEFEGTWSYKDKDGCCAFLLDSCEVIEAAINEGFEIGSIRNGSESTVDFSKEYFILFEGIHNNNKFVLIAQ